MHISPRGKRSLAAPQRRCRPRRLYVRDEDWEWLSRVGEGNASAGLRAAIGTTRVVRHDLNGVREALTMNARLAREMGHPAVADLLERVDGRIVQVMVK